MAGVQAGGDRQHLHERIRQHSQAAAAEVKEHGRPNDLLERLAADEAFAAIDLSAAVDPALLTGRSAQQVDEFLEQVVAPIRQRYASRQVAKEELRV
jgi:adenylosuccinate lyase